MKNNGIMIITALPRPFLSLHVTGNKHSINGGLSLGSLSSKCLKSELQGLCEVTVKWGVVAMGGHFM